MVQHAIDKLHSLLTMRKQFCHEVGLVLMCIYISSPPFIPGATFSNEVVSDALRFLLELRLWDTGIAKHRLVVPINVHWTNNRDSHHPELVTQTTQVFTAELHRTEFTSKAARLNRSLLLREPIDQSIVQVDHETGPRSRVTVSVVWSASTVARKMKPFGGMMSFPAR